MDLSQRVRAILSFVEAANAGSFTKAAASLGISSAAVSKNVASLEQVLGLRLMNRTTRKLNLTEEGEAFLKQARIALTALETATDTVAAQKTEICGHVRISTSSAFGRDFLLLAIPPLLARYPTLSIEVDMDDRLIDLVQDGYDLVIRGGRIVDSSLISRHVCDLSMILVASPAYLAKQGIPKTPQDLKQHKLIIRRFLGGKVSPWHFKQPDGRVITLDPSTAILSLSAPEALVQAACLHAGIAQVSIQHALPALMRGDLKIVLFDQHDAGSYEMVIQYPHRVLVAPRVRATVEHLLATFRQNETLHTSLDQLARFSC
ncbi:LysR family transcriptional regulator [Utexia brackfieldae]|uniref:LysR family transcriptional regulator n=1 Tax=Utexia brackfieldae TaxID=3074108 RepID=UPI00370D63CD